jgi:hypothetical protein
LKVARLLHCRLTGRDELTIVPSDLPNLDVRVMRHDLDESGAGLPRAIVLGVRPGCASGLVIDRSEHYNGYSDALEHGCDSFLVHTPRKVICIVRESTNAFDDPNCLGRLCRIRPRRRGRLDFGRPPRLPGR